MKLRNLATLALMCLLVAGVASAQTTPAPGTSASLTWQPLSATNIPYAFRIYDIALSSTQTACPAFSKTTWKLAQDSLSSTTLTWKLSGVLTAGVTYCFAITSYNTNNGLLESGASNLLLLPDPTQGGGDPTTSIPPSPSGLNGTRQ